MNEISAQELKERLDKGEKLILLDVREKLEYYSYNIGGIHVPLVQLMEEVEVLPEDPSTEIIVICQKGVRSKTAQTLLMQAGYTNIKNLKGGLSAFHRI